MRLDHITPKRFGDYENNPETLSDIIVKLFSMIFESERNLLILDELFFLTKERI